MAKAKLIACFVLMSLPVATSFVSTTADSKQRSSSILPINSLIGNKHQYIINSGGRSKTRLYLSFLDFGTNTINAPVLHSSMAVSGIPNNDEREVQSRSSPRMNNSTMMSPPDSTMAANIQTVEYYDKSLEVHQRLVAESSIDMAASHQQALLSSIQQQQIQQPSDSKSSFVSSFMGYRLLLAGVACVYGSNFPLGSILDQHLPPSAASCSRFFLAALALSPFLFKIEKELIGTALLAGCFTATGYISQSLALADTSPATVSFLGAATVIWCPFLEFIIHKKSMSWNDRPQVYIAGLFCLIGVALLELVNGVSVGVGNAVSLSSTGGLLGDGLALLQAVGFGTGVFMSEHMMKKYPHQALPITAVLVAVTAFLSLIWALTDGWMFSDTPGWESMLLPNILMGNTVDLMAGDNADPFLLAKAVLWTGLISTSLNFFLEIYALGQVPPAEASVVLATEPLWAAAFAAIILGESFGWNDYVGGCLIVVACLVSSIDAEKIHNFLGNIGIGNNQSDK